MRKSFLYILFIFITFQNINAQLSKKHFIPPLTYAEEGNANPNDQYFYISTPKDENISFKIKKIGSSDDIIGTVSRTAPKIISLQNGEGQLFVNSNQTSQVHNNKGYIIEADDVIYVSVRMNAGGALNATSGPQAGALVSKGASALGTIFRAGMYTNKDSPVTGNYLNFISVMATENGTVVKFDDLPIGLSIKKYGILTATSLSVNLNEGESYIIATNASDNVINEDGLIGTLIESDDIKKPIVVNIGSANGSFDNGGGRDYGLDQIVDESKVGTEYIFVKGRGNDEWENVLIVGHTSGTDIFINGNPIKTTTIEPGEYYIIEGDNFGTNNNMYVRTSKKVFAYQGIGGLNAAGNPAEANQGMFFVPPLSCENRKAVINIPKIDKIGEVDFKGGITIVTNKTAVIKLNSTILDITNAKTVTGNRDYVTYEILDLTNDVIIESTDELYCAYFNYNGSASSGSFYSGFPSSPEINFNTSVSTTGNCIGNDLKLKAANEEIFDEFEWFFDDGTGFTSTANKTTEITPTTPGRYQLRTKIICDGTVISEWNSIEIPVSICPDDYDNDNIIDNLDNDIDNDGILNCDESLGDKIINFTNVNTPTIPDNLATIIGSLDNDSNANLFSGDNNGNFTSTVNTSTTGSISTYNLKFSKNINLNFTQQVATTHNSINDEYFIIRIGPSNKNITLLDPDDQLLIATNFDDNFKSGITNISASEIWFKYATTTSASTFKFVANQVKQLTFEHHSKSSTSQSIFNGNIQLTCFSRDSDSDGIENMFDLDTDNDGIPDLYDAYGQNIVLTKTDTNLDGLDDVFDTITTNLDTDGDGVKNYLDYDTDNDGIFDVVEAGYGNFDTDNDGRVNGTVGTNGLLDNLETSPDSGALKTPIKNSDRATLIVANQDVIFDFVDLDSDGDDCFDVIEAGFTGDGSGRLSPNHLDVDNNGKVENSNGYTIPNANYTTSAPITITSFIDVTFCEVDTDTISIVMDLDASEYSFQWEVSTDGTTWNPISDDSIYSGSNTNSLQITDTPFSYNNYQYKVALNRTGNSCGLISNAITLTVNPKPALLNNEILLKQCAADVSRNTIINLTEAEKTIIDNTDSKFSFEYYETETDAINGDATKLVTGTDIENYPVTSGFSEAGVRVIANDNGCFSIAKIEINAEFIPDITIDTPFEECDDFIDIDAAADGITNFDFSSAVQTIKDSPGISDPDKIEVFFYETISDRDAAINPIPDISNHRNSKDISYAYNQTIYFKIKNKNNNDCEGIGKLSLKTNEIPVFSVDGEDPDNPIIICTKNIPYTLQVNTLGDYKYEWTKNGDPFGGNSKEVDINDAGNYTVTAFSKTTKVCSYSRTIIVLKSNFETLEESFVTITDDTSGISSNLSIRIDIPTNPLINEEFLFALEDENGNTIRSFQDSNTFEDIEGGIYKIIVENKDGCGISELIVSVIQFPKFFTPNGDTKNNTWFVKGASNTLYQSNSSINIFDRYGKLVAQTTIGGEGWDGTYNGKLLPSNDYWFTAQLIPIDTNKMPILKKGHFSLIRK
ncbi:T9SS type B sorting domain-containing protein [Polaribacter sp. Q13]|uniref:T9SS type B sorting domain-containing protein n=1 Tax=Polaribacter sp. Q13 TaxID=2806551 RepID=UPI00193B66A7|nr:T9SS type B sorting domain-containing protein [Polaribacter sp. Q13]QVY66688.1 T9SS type B sorting domain-containing protein [Polaribacter sp. Q13]